MIKLSIILPVHNEEDIIENVYSELKNFLKQKKISTEIILVENGSRDDSFTE